MQRRTTHLNLTPNERLLKSLPTILLMGIFDVRDSASIVQRLEYSLRAKLILLQGRRRKWGISANADHS